MDFRFAPRLARLCAVVCLAAGVTAALAAPSVDAVADLLAERGLAPAAAPAPPAAPTSLVDRMRGMKDRAGDMIVSAMNFLGVPYRRGGSSDQGFDCSGFTRHVFESNLGFVLPRKVDEQARAPGLVTVKRDELEPGDLVFFNTLRRTFSHVGIYIGDGKFIHSPRTGGSVRLEDMTQRYWTKRFTGARRADPLRTASVAGPAATESLPAPAAVPAAAPAVAAPPPVAEDAETLRQRY
jgi:cell wall-associated NlpC family hydrolase